MIAWMTGWKPAWPNVHGAQHDLLGQFARLAFHHQHALGGAGDHQLEVGVLHLLDGRVQDVLAVLEADAGGGDRAEERDAGQRQRRRATDHGDDVGIVLEVVAEHGRDHLDLVAEALREQRAHRAVDKAAGQHLLLGRPAFPLEEAARDLAGGEGLFLVVDGQREEVLSGLLRPHADGGAQHDGVAVARQHGAVGLAGDLAGLQDQRAAAPVEFLAEVVEHASCVLRDARHRRTASQTTRGLASERIRRFGPHGCGPRAPAGCGRRGRGQVAGNAVAAPEGGPDRRSVGPPRVAASGAVSRSPALPRATIGTESNLPTSYGDAGRDWKAAQRRRLSRPISVS